MKLNEIVCEYLNSTHGTESHSAKLLTVLIDYWAKERDYEIKGDLLKKLVLKYSVAERRLAELNREKNRFLGIAAHDLRNPLISIRGFSEILMDEMDGCLRQHQKEYLSMIYTTSDAMLTLVNDILDVSAIENGGIELRMSKGSLKKLLEGRIRIHKMLAERKGIVLRRRLADVQPFNFDPNRISQVVDNLIGNALKFSPEGKSVYLSLKRRGMDAEVSVRDEGPGISQEDLPKLFGEYQTLGAKATGGEKCTGLGLAIAKRIVDEHAGKIEVRSQVGIGSTFTLLIPMEAADGKK